MKIANQKTFEQFDNLKEQLFAHKHQQHHQSKVIKNPFSAKFRFLLPVCLMIGGAWLVYRNIPYLKDYLLQNNKISYQSSLAYETLKTYTNYRMSQWMKLSQGKSKNNLATNLYITKLESDYLYLTQKSPQKLLDNLTKSRLSVWVFNFGNQQTIHLINEYGDLVKRSRSYKFGVGDLIKVWTRTQDTIVKREKIFSYYLRQREMIGNQCERVNFLVKLQTSQQEYQKELANCNESANKLRKRFGNFIDDRLKREIKRRVVVKDNK